MQGDNAVAERHLGPEVAFHGGGEAKHCVVELQRALHVLGKEEVLDLLELHEGTGFPREYSVQALLAS